ncbi:kelch repeat-containing protein [uncultured Pontibacter sp.]|uniref:Kelch repeat-containing protein n=1 Tax=uncultured Pontibacter sp. TaxID=453356 RepID=UPI002626CCEF|nr:kelch repeat-containing protein [uncultured Pontibacter sp.]
MKIPFKNTRLFMLMALLLSVGILSSCESDSDDEVLLGEWQKQSDFAGVARSSSVSFVIDGKAYVGTGHDGSKRLNDFWMFDAATNNWVKKADFPGAARSAAVGFSANGKGYIGTGYDGTGYLNDFYEYDPAANTWTQIADFPATARYGAIAMSFSNAGYIGAGFDGNYQKDFWKYDPATATWTEQVGLIGAKRLNGFAFTVNGKGYVGGGQNNNVYQTDLLEFDPATSQWRTLKTLTNEQRPDEDYPAPRTYAATFSIQNNGYVVGGTNGASLNDVWKFDPASDTWTQLGSFKGGIRVGAIGFGIGDYGYVGLGNSGSLHYDDIWQLNPTIVNE